MVMPTGLTWIVLILLTIVASQAANPSHLVRNLPGQPQVQFKQYAGHLVVNASAQRAYFYWFFEADHQNQTSQPLALWLSGGPGCSSVGAGAFGEIGPFSVDISGTKLEKRRNAWNKASDNLQFLLEWFRNFPEYSKNEFYLLGESYSGHYIPTLAMKILENNANGKNIINLKGFSVRYCEMDDRKEQGSNPFLPQLGNAWTDPAHDMRGDVEFYYSHSLIPEQTYNELIQNCDFSTMRPILGGSMNPNCQGASAITNRLISGLSHYNIYKPPCKNGSSITLEGIRVLPGIRYNCVHATALQILDPEKTSNLDIQVLCKSLPFWFFTSPRSGDADGVVSTLSTRSWIKELNLTSQTPWFVISQVAGWSQAYNGLTFLTVLGAGHMVPLDKPQQALSLFEHFLKGKVPPSFAN
ncbi:serine carboxypeptidase-like 25 [Selaginella moellendorffii]|uniref:serine carboxypeptidase-like 25 n=1 Tax=Selaginella moellendorffii TaxID=88036 RepID=UPI000D1CDD88|nr:serine carboxypeptidase-like 25 [Selaginella moellendorffii]|eukprot:XP_024515025.1 serine carboxypeptidase-like 25 [Selaginella moellendorffii]